MLGILKMSYNNRVIPKRYQKLYDRAMKGKSRKAAMKSFCIECMGYDHEEVLNCVDEGCPMFPYRQVKNVDKTSN